jgi:hypothetical protein
MDTTERGVSGWKEAQREGGFTDFSNVPKIITLWFSFTQGCYRTATTVVTSLYAEMANVINVGENSVTYRAPLAMGVSSKYLGD